MTPVAQNSHAIGEEHDFLDPVGDVDDRYAGTR